MAPLWGEAGAGLSPLWRSGGYSCMGSQGCSPGMVMASGMELSPPRRSGHAPVVELRVGVLECGTTMAFWAHRMLDWSPLLRSMGEPGGLWCGFVTTITCWDHSGGGAKGVVLEWGWTLSRICHHYRVLGTFRWGSEGCSSDGKWSLIRICHHYSGLGPFRWGS